MRLSDAAPKTKRDQGGGRHDARRKEQRANRISTIAPQASNRRDAEERHSWGEIESLTSEEGGSVAK
jgi:hypothetical protein